MSREPPLPLAIVDGRANPRWLGAADAPWLRALIDEYERFVGERRGALVERLREPLPRPAPRAKVSLATRVLDLCYRTERASAVDPRRARAELFAAGTNAPYLARDAVVASVAGHLGVEVAELEASLFADLPAERRLLPSPRAVEPAWLALEANLRLAQGLIARATSVRLELEGGARAVIRHAKLRGLIGTVLPRERTQDAELELSGPFALFRRTLLYGHALAAIVPLLAWCDRFRLQAELVIAGKSLAFELATGDPFLPATEPRRFDSKLEARFARDFARAALDWDVIREPEPVPAEGTLVFPDFALQHRRDPTRRWLLEIVGFWTRSYLEEKLGRLRAAEIPRLILCVDEERNVGQDDLPAGSLLVPFRKRIDPTAVLKLIEPEGSTGGLSPRVEERRDRREPPRRVGVARARGDVAERAGAVAEEDEP